MPPSPAIADPERALSLAYAPREARPALAALWALDERLGEIVRTTSEPAVGQMRLTWWHDALAALGTGPAPAEPLLEAVAGLIETPAGLLPLIDGWEALLDPLPLGADALDLFAEGRGGTLFACAATILGARAGEEIRSAGRGWALADLAFKVSDRTTALAAIEAARQAFALAPQRWPPRLRAIGMLAELAGADARTGLDRPRRQGSPRRLLRALRHRLTGR